LRRSRVGWFRCRRLVDRSVGVEQDLHHLGVASIYGGGVVPSSVVAWLTAALASSRTRTTSRWPSTGVRLMTHPHDFAGFWESSSHFKRNSTRVSGPHSKHQFVTGSCNSPFRGSISGFRETWSQKMGQSQRDSRDANCCGRPPSCTLDDLLASSCVCHATPPLGSRNLPQPRRTPITVFHTTKMEHEHEHERRQRTTTTVRCHTPITACRNTTTSAGRGAGPAG
jgi:hypothetical protein